ncbi:UDP-N-acetylmuramoyl-L-alanyl-D-glutamate--2,6-diaminopimelate ligase [Actinomadura livida]|uniref:UDP-N-acetylmuramoyl-L-alanyl-D-glutamate--2,6-diaminopimelate ligase n=1 Tax=Actinomadura livida TaxID=79909 RepID=A0A7W7IFX2_9ACTN|nr:MULTISPECIES: UDP-N-acetylmuramoyl-L-alanyl-D-glutamate--2,6-diaminopimelate ligase [Actinomadura]MBB4776352.1 UDP-N-acetylmuramoyl-L-alanyl-D-glutamate--2,6-diaminopimelate ligase [Actinomadura catellatispora]GGU32642.1 UDP-N-acetylmuramoyl-L-alanyl-D-glutamate--2,6-diaminopimelate ligase [Actinomadura livida]
MRPTTNPSRPLNGLAALFGIEQTGWEAVSATGITHDSRAVRRGDIYAALPGTRAHGARFAAQAADAGAAAILTDHGGYDRAAATGLPVMVVPDVRARLGEAASWVYGEPGRDITLIGVTGTSGKTTTVFLLDAGLRAAGIETGLVGGVEIRVAGRRVPSALTTPESTDLHALLAMMRERDVGAASMEVSSHALVQGRVGGAVFEVAVFTNLSQDHLDYHPTMHDYFLAKARLFTPEYSRVGVINLDDHHGRELLEIATVPVTTFSASGDPAADWRAEDVRVGADGSVFRIVGPGGIEADAEVGLAGPFNVANALAAIVALVEAGVPLQAAVHGVASLPGVPGRLERVDEGQDFVTLVDYSHKPGAVEAVLNALRPVTEGELAIVLGCGGDRDRGKRPLMGEAAARLADSAYFTSDNPRSEDPLAILAAMVEGGLKVPQPERARVVVEPDRAAAIALAVGRARRGDVLVIAGKGHEQGQNVAGEVHPFDDREVAREALRRRVKGTRGDGAQA